MKFKLTVIFIAAFTLKFLIDLMQRKYFKLAMGF